MKGQLIFEFLVAGLIFFVIVLYTINYLNYNVSDYRSKFYHNRLQNKAIQVSEILMSGKTNLSISDGVSFVQSAIDRFNATYCSYENYKKLAEDFYMYENTNYGVVPNDVRIELGIPSSGLVLLNCGPNAPRMLNTTKAEVGRVGIYQDEIARLRVTVW